MTDNERWLFIVSTSIHLITYGLACLACLAFVAWQWFFNDKYMAVFAVIGACIGLPMMAPDPETLRTWRYLLTNNDDTK